MIIQLGKVQMFTVVMKSLSLIKLMIFHFTDKILPLFTHATEVCVCESLPLSDAPDQTCFRREPWEIHLDLLLAVSECETSGFRCN